MQPSEQNQIQGYVDGYREGRIYGWAWCPSTPEEALPIEVLVDGKIVAESAAWVPRPDLSEAGIGDGRHGFDVPVSLDMDRLSSTRVVVRVKDGEPLPSLPGALMQGELRGAEVPLDANVAAFVDSILKSGAQNEESQVRQGHPSVQGSVPPAVRFQPRDNAAMNFIVFCPTATDQPAAGEVSKRGTRVNGLLARLLKTVSPVGGELGVSVAASDDSRGNHPDHVYSFVAPAFKSLLGRLGKVHVARDSVQDVNRIHESCVARHENCLLLYFAPPHQMVLGSRCPVIPVIAWGYPDIPSEAWGGDQRSDWRHVLVQTAGAITLSGFAAAAVRSAMGEKFPVLAVPAPVWDRSPTASTKPPVRSPQKSTRLEFPGLVFDSRNHVFRPSGPLPQPPHRKALAAAEPTSVTLDGVVFTAVTAPRDGTENWQEMLTAFVAEFSEEVDATLVFKMTGRSLSDWWWELNDLLTRMPAFRCRVVALQDLPNDARYAELIATTHWIVNASKCEAVCLPSLQFMSAGRPAVTPAHTAMADWIDASNAMVVRSEDICCGWPHDARQRFTTLRQSVDWPSLREAMREAYRITKSDAARYAAMSDAAMATTQRFCADTVVLRALAGFLGLRTDPSAVTPKLAPT